MLDPKYFPLPIKLHDLADGTDYPFELEDIFVFRPDQNDHSKDIVVPAGFRYDFASIPDFAKSVFNPFGKYDPASLIHDWMYCCHNVTRPQADRLFLDIMQLVGVPWRVRRPMWLAVRLGGWVGWSKRDSVVREYKISGIIAASQWYARQKQSYLSEQA